MLKSALLATPVPRYTSYPTAPHFHAGIDSRAYGRWLAEIPKTLPLSLYLHIPFCRTLCWFCGCHTTATKNYAPVNAYCELLLKEIELLSDALGPEPRPVAHIHWGGGSPTILSPQDIARLDGAIRRRFQVSPDAEIAVEIDPRTLRPEIADAFVRAGMTRASIGMQDCDPAVQKAINRIQPRQTIRAAIDLLRQAEIGGINLDLVYGLPKQTAESWARTLDFALQMQPDRLSVFGYAHVPSFKKHQALIPAELLPEMETRIHLADMASRLLTANGYVAVGLDHFAKPGDSLAQSAQSGSLTRNFQGYSTDSASALLGLGASAIGTLPDGYVQNAPRLPAYRQALEAGQLPVVRGVALSAEDRVRRHVIQRLMCDYRVDIAAACKQFGISPAILHPSLNKLSDLVRSGAVALENHTVSVAPQWRGAVRLACAAFDTYLGSAPATHSMPV